ncbi:MAG: excinuclease ABC subunit UvrB [Candidatus Cloacimonetes bacterium]|nr:excinuclease ABC subunit UvrB [Candidatus Cloacimonadota bacterium]
MNKFKLTSKYKPTGDQPEAIKELSENIIQGDKFQILLGATGSGKTFTIANVIKNVNKPTLIMSHNKTLAAQLYGEFRQLFPENAVEYFISYYDYYQPEAYIPGKDLYIDKDFDINKQIERLRLRATTSLSERKDVIIIASISCIYGLGIPDDYREAALFLKKGQTIEREELMMKLISGHYGRNDVAFERGNFRVRGDIIDIYPAYLENSVRVQFFGDEIEKITRINPINGHIIEEVKEYPIYPANHFVMSVERKENAVSSIKDEMNEQIRYFLDHNKLVEAQRIEQRTLFDLEMIKEIGYCSGIENYSRHLTGSKIGEPPYCLFDYFPEDFLLVIDESHASVPQVRAMYGGDYTRKKNLVEYGFRLPSAYDNRPLKFEEFESYIPQVIFVSATPGDYELEKTKGVVVEQVIRPTGLVDPHIDVRPIETQVDDVLHEINIRIKKNQRILITTLTKKMAEDLAKYITDAGVKVKYLHSEVQTIERSKIIRELRLGEIDVIVGINLLREGLDMPEVSLVAILDADKAGFLRSTRSLIQTAGRAARNIDGTVIFYADEVTQAMRETINETNRRRKKQLDYNEKHGITPKQIEKSTDEILKSTSVADGYADYEINMKTKKEKKNMVDEYLNLETKEDLIALLKKDMKKAASELNFELAADLRDRIIELEVNM